MNSSFINDLDHTLLFMREFAHCQLQWQKAATSAGMKGTHTREGRRGGKMNELAAAPGVVGPFAGLDVPWLLKMRAEVRRDHPFLIWAPVDAPSRHRTHGAFHPR